MAYQSSMAVTTVWACARPGRSHRPGGPAQTVGDGLFATVEEVEESADFGDGERDETSTGGYQYLISRPIDGSELAVL